MQNAGKGLTECHETGFERPETDEKGFERLPQVLLGDNQNVVLRNGNHNFGAKFWFLSNGTRFSDSHYSSHQPEPEF